MPPLYEIITLLYVQSCYYSVIRLHIHFCHTFIKKIFVKKIILQTIDICILMFNFQRNCIRMYNLSCIRKCKNWKFAISRSKRRKKKMRENSVTLTAKNLMQIVHLFDVFSDNSYLIIMVNVPDVITGHIMVRINFINVT